MIRSQYTDPVQLNSYDVNRPLETPKLWCELVLLFSNCLITAKEEIKPPLTKQFLEAAFKHQPYYLKQSKSAYKKFTQLLFNKDKWAWKLIYQSGLYLIKKGKVVFDNNIPLKKAKKSASF